MLPTERHRAADAAARRLAAEDTSIDLMSLDPVFTAEFANGRLPAAVPPGRDRRRSPRTSWKARSRAATWETSWWWRPLWANTQVLWYRKSLAEAAGLDMTKPVTWDQIIDAAADKGGQVGVQANKYEGYVVWINALIRAPAATSSPRTQAGSEASVDIASRRRCAAAEVIEQARRLTCRPARPVGFQRGHGARPPLADPGGFMVNWTFAYNTIKRRTRGPSTISDGPGTRRRSKGEESRPPIGGINIGVSAFTDDPDWRSMPSSASRRRGEPGPVRRRDRQHAGSPGGVRGRRSSPSSSRPTCCSCSGQHGHRWSAAPHRRTGAPIVDATLSQWHPADSVDPDRPRTPVVVGEALHGDASELEKALL